MCYCVHVRVWPGVGGVHARRVRNRALQLVDVGVNGTLPSTLSALTALTAFGELPKPAGVWWGMLFRPRVTLRRLPIAPHERMCVCVCVRFPPQS